MTIEELKDSGAIYFEKITEGMQIVFAGSISDVLKEALVQK